MWRTYGFSNGDFCSFLENGGKVVAKVTHCPGTGLYRLAVEGKEIWKDGRFLTRVKKYRLKAQTTLNQWIFAGCVFAKSPRAACAQYRKMGKFALAKKITTKYKP